jgi:hypothetical protein
MYSRFIVDDKSLAEGCDRAGKGVPSVISPAFGKTPNITCFDKR